MGADVHLRFINYSYIQVVGERSTILDLHGRMRFQKQDSKYDPRVKRGKWDGFVSLLNSTTGIIYAGLAFQIMKICKELGYSVSIDDELLYDEVSLEEVKNHVASLNLPSWIDTRDYQIEATAKCIRSRRRIFVSPTSSGKSLMMYFLFTWYKKKTLIIVPSIGLVNQLKNDFISYGYQGSIVTSAEHDVKQNNLPGDLVISTWHSIDNGKSSVEENWFDQFEVIIGDEAHTCQAKTLISILSKAKNVPFKFGTTGSMPKDDLNKHTIEGLFGPISTTITTKQMIDRGYASKLTIKCIVLKYPKEVIQEYWDTRLGKDVVRDAVELYNNEIDFLIQHEGRNKFIKNLALSLEGNKLIFFRRRQHGNTIYDMLKEQPNPVFFIDQTVSGEDREKIRNQMEAEDNATLVASMKTTATGVSIKNLIHLIAGAPTKSRTTLIQGVGRMLRLHEKKTERGAILYDIVDDLSLNGRDNFALSHFRKRAEIYSEEQHQFKIYSIRLKNG